MDYLASNKNAWNRQSERYLKETDLSNTILDFGDPRCLTKEGRSGYRNRYFGTADYFR